MMRGFVIVVAFFMLVIQASVVEACRCIDDGKPGCPCLTEYTGDTSDDYYYEDDYQAPLVVDPAAVYERQRRRAEKLRRKMEAQQRAEAERQAKKYRVKLVRQQREAAEELRNRLKEEKWQLSKLHQERISDALNKIESILKDGKKNTPRGSLKKDIPIRRKVDQRELRTLVAKLKKAATETKNVTLSESTKAALDKALSQSIELDPEESIGVFGGIKSYVFGDGKRRTVELKNITLDPKVIEKRLVESSTLLYELKRVQKGKSTGISFYQPYKTIRPANRDYILGNIDLKIEADLTVTGKSFTLTNVRVVGGCDVYDPIWHGISDDDKNQRSSKEHSIRKLLKKMPGKGYPIELVGKKKPLQDMEGKVPAGLPSKAPAAPECVEVLEKARKSKTKTK